MKLCYSVILVLCLGQWAGIMLWYS